MAARSTLSATERKRLHRNLSVLRSRGWRTSELARSLDLSVTAVGNLLQSPERGTSEGRAAQVAQLVASNATPSLREGTATMRRGRKAASSLTKSAGRGRAGKSAPKHRSRGTGKRTGDTAVADATPDMSNRSSMRAGRGPRPRGLAADMLPGREAKQFVRRVHAAKSAGLRIGELARAAGYRDPSSFSMAMRRGRIPRDVAERFEEAFAAQRATKRAAPTRSSTNAGTNRPRRGRGRNANRVQRETMFSRADGGARAEQPTGTAVVADQDRTTTGTGTGSPSTATTVIEERTVTLPTVQGPADVERRNHFVEQVAEARVHLSRARESLQLTLDTGSATVISAPGIERILEMLQHLREELAAT